MAIWTQDSIFINCLGSTLMISNIMQYRVTNKYGWTTATLKFLNGLAADLRFATATNNHYNGMNTYEIYTVIIPKKLDATQISARLDR